MHMLGACIVLQFCRRNSQPIDFAEDMWPTWHVSPSYYHYLGAAQEAGCC